MVWSAMRLGRQLVIGGRQMDKYLEIKERFEGVKDGEKAVQMAKYMRNKFAFYGIPTPERKKLYRDIIKSEKKSGVVDWALLDRCYEDEHREFQYFVCDYLLAMEQYLTYEDIPAVRKYIETRPWWDTIDFLDKVVGDIGLKDDRVRDLMLEWSKDRNFWVRRIAIDHQLGRKERTDRQLLEAIIVNNFGSDEFFINKAIGWSLREYSKTDPDWVRAFLEKYGPQMSKLSVREAGKYV